MRVERLELEGFRNIRAMEFVPGPAVNVICGDNAQGKTNLLEAIWLFTGSRSFRGAKDKDYPSFDGEVASLKLDFFAGERTQEASIVYGGDKRAVHLNGVKQENVGKLSGIFRGVVFSPDHLSMIKEGPEKRRRMIDSSLCQAYPKYRKALEGYERSLKQRNHLLKDIGGHAGLLELLDVWDENLIRYGGYIAWMRSRYVKRLGQAAAEAYDGISTGKETFSAQYEPTFSTPSIGPEKEDFTAAFRESIKKSRGEDIRLGSTSMGPHRDDVEIRVNGVSARSYGSQGQQRSCVLALKLAECVILEESAGEPPVVLLDDVMSELDQGRRGYLLEKLTGRQILITCCEAELYRELGDGRVFRISGGALEEPAAH